MADTVLRILTNHGILRFLRNNCKSLDTVTVRDLGIGVFKNLLTVTYQTPLMKALEMLSNYKVSSLPIVNERNIPVDMYTRSDVRYLAMDNSWTHLDMTLEQALEKHQKGRVLPLCTRDDTIATVAGLLVSTMKHSLICVDPVSGIIEGVVSLTDIFSFVLNSGPPKAESRIAALKQENENIDAIAMSEATARQQSRINFANSSQPGSPNLGPRTESSEDSAMQMLDIDPSEDFLR
jgi:CBS domain-containing protein